MEAARLPGKGEEDRGRHGGAGKELVKAQGGGAEQGLVQHGSPGRERDRLWRLGLSH